jgi:hypothetical protein
MGLDQYLDKVKYFGYENSHYKNEKEKTKIIINGKKYPSDIHSIKYSVTTWRKFSALHKWMVDNVQEGVDDCKTYFVSRYLLKDLNNLLKKTIEETVKNSRKYIQTENKDDIDKSIALKLFPPPSENIDDYYFEEVIRTQKLLQKLIDSHDFRIWDYYYDSSW